MASEQTFSEWYFEYCKARNRTPSMEEVWIAARSTQAPAATEAPSKPFAYYIHIAAEQRGEFVHDLDEALDDLTNCECKITELFDRATPAPAVGASPAAESALTWTQGDDPICKYNHAQARTPFGRILVTWKGWKPYPSFYADEMPGDECGCGLSAGTIDEAMREAEAIYQTRLLAAVGASVQPVLASPSDEGALSVTCPHCWQKAGEPCIWPDRSRNRGTSHDDRKAAALASSTPTKGGEAS